MPEALCRVSIGAGNFVQDILDFCCNFYCKKKLKLFFRLIIFIVIRICIASGAKLSFATVFKQSYLDYLVQKKLIFSKTDLFYEII